MSCTKKYKLMKACVYLLIWLQNLSGPTGVVVVLHKNGHQNHQTYRHRRLYATWKRLRLQCDDNNLGPHAKQLYYTTSLPLQVPSSSANSSRHWHTLMSECGSLAFCPQYANWMHWMSRSHAIPMSETYKCATVWPTIDVMVVWTNNNKQTLPWGVLMQSSLIGCVWSAHRHRRWLSTGSLPHDVFGHCLQLLSFRHSDFRIVSEFPARKRKK